MGFGLLVAIGTVVVGRGVRSCNFEPAAERPSRAPVVVAPPREVDAGDYLRCVDEVRPECPVLHPTTAVLAQRARCGILLFDRPSFKSAADRNPGGGPLSETDQKRYQTEDRLKEELWNPLLALHRELTGTRYRGGDQLEELLFAIHPRASREGGLDRKLAEERAGLRPLPAAAEVARAPAAERFWRLRLGIGDRYQRILAGEIGPRPAQELREESNGWETKEIYRGECPPDGSGGGGGTGTGAAEARPLRRALAGLDEHPQLTERRLLGQASCARDGCPFLHPSPEQLAERARCAVVQVDLPFFLEPQAGQKDGDRPPPWQFGETALAEARRPFAAELVRELQGFFKEMGGAPGSAPQTFQGLNAEMEKLASSGASYRSILRTLAEERAGVRQPPGREELAALPPEQKYWRWLTLVGDRYQRLLAGLLGEEPARQLRERLDGWSQKRIFMGTCRDLPAEKD